MFTSGSLRSFFWCWFSGSTGSDGKKGLSLNKRIVLFALLVFLVYPAGLLVLPHAAAVYLPLVTAGLDGWHALSGKPLAFFQEGRAIYFRSTVAPFFQATFETHLIWASQAFFLALILAGPGLKPGVRLRALLAGVGILYLYHVAFGVAGIELSMIQQKLPMASRAEYFWASADYFLKIPGVVLFPLAAWMAFGLKPLLEGEAAPGGAPPTEPVGRNRPCPCGSGKKYKHCCGRS